MFRRLIVFLTLAAGLVTLIGGYAGYFPLKNAVLIAKRSKEAIRTDFSGKTEPSVDHSYYRLWPKQAHELARQEIRRAERDLDEHSPLLFRTMGAGALLICVGMAMWLCNTLTRERQLRETQSAQAIT